MEYLDCLRIPTIVNEYVRSLYPCGDSYNDLAHNSVRKFIGGRGSPMYSEAYYLRVGSYWEIYQGTGEAKAWER